jgi:hypothetical protein
LLILFIFGPSWAAWGVTTVVLWFIELGVSILVSCCVTNLLDPAASDADIFFLEHYPDLLKKYKEACLFFHVGRFDRIETIKEAIGHEFLKHEPEKFKDDPEHVQKEHLLLFFEVRAKYLVIIEFRRTLADFEARKISLPPEEETERKCTIQ